jgi:hypothetical protein
LRLRQRRVAVGIAQADLDTPAQVRDGSMAVTT